MLLSWHLLARSTYRMEWRIFPIVVLYAMCSAGAIAQTSLTGEVDYPQLGIGFTIPDGWQAQEGDGLVYMGSETVPGLIVMIMHESRDMAAMKHALAEGFSEDGIELFPQGEARELRSDMAVIDHTGQIEGQPAKGIAFATLNPYGNGVAVIAIGLEDSWSDRLVHAAESTINSIEFRKVEHTGPSVETWKRNLMNTRLTKIESYSSPSAIEGGVGGGYSSKQQIDLCDGWFTMSGSGSVSAGSDVVSGHSSGSSAGNGTWDVVEGIDGRPVLRLDHHDGRRSEFLLGEEEGKTYLNGERWFRTWEGENAPACR